MSLKNVEIVRRFVEYWNQTGDFAWELLDPDTVWTVDPDAWLAGIYRGPEGLQEIRSRLAEAFATCYLLVDEYVDAGDAVVTLSRFMFRDRVSGVETGQPLAFVVHFREGRVVAIQNYLRADEALDAAGLRDQPH